MSSVTSKWRIKAYRITFRELARRNLIDLATIEREIFAVSFDNGKLVPIQPRYWDLHAGGTTAVILRKALLAGAGRA